MPALTNPGGHPPFLAELAHGGATSEGDARLTLDGSFRARVAPLPRHVRRVLALVCIAGSPLPHGVLAGALNVGLGALSRSLAVLRIGRLVRSVQHGDVVAYQDRVSESVTSAHDEAHRARIHLALAEAWQRAERSSAAHVAQHYLAAGQATRAAPWLERAAEEARETAAFERLAELLETRLSLHEAPLDEVTRSWQNSGRALRWMLPVYPLI